MPAVEDQFGGRYERGELISRGGMADVYLGVDVKTGRAVALKLLRNVDPVAVKRFAGEARMLARLEHPAVVRLRDTGEHDGQPYLVLDLVEGPTLAQRLAEGPLSVAETLALGAAIADALAAAHALGCVHRDVKPSNVLLGSTGPMLADFGISRLVGEATLTATGVLIGSAPYLAPEQVRGEPVGPPADIYALALLLLECITGRRAYEGPPMEAAMARLQRPPDMPDDLPEALQRLLGRMTSDNPRDRPSAVDVRQVLHNQETATRTDVVPIGTTAPMLRPRQDAGREPGPPSRRRRFVGRSVLSGSLAMPAGRRDWSPGRWVVVAAGVVAGAVIGVVAIADEEAPQPSPSSNVPPTLVDGRPLPEPLADALEDLERAVRE